MHIDQRMEPKDRAFQGCCCWSLQEESVCEVHTWRLNKTWCFSYAFSSIPTSRLHFIAVWPELHLIIILFSFRIQLYQGLISQSKVLCFVVKIESSKAVSINIGQQGINRNNIYGTFTGLFLWWVITFLSGGSGAVFSCGSGRSRAVRPLSAPM